MKKYVPFIKLKKKTKYTIKICNNSLLFDKTWYLNTYPDVKAANMDPVVHYVTNGALEGRDPGPHFSTNNYLRANPHIKALGINPLFYFEKLDKTKIKDFTHESLIKTELIHELKINKKSLKKKPPVKAIAFYLPQFHCIPENDEWWGTGFTEWSNTRRGLPMFEDHYQPHVPHPDIGYYDLTDATVLERQTDLAKKFGIYGFCFYYYWFNGRRLLEMPLERMLQSGKPDIPFCFCWANGNWTRTWDGLDKEILMEQIHTEDSDARFIYDLLPVFLDPRYIKIDEKPLLIIYQPKIMPNVSQTTQLWRRVCREEGIGEIHLAFMSGFSIKESKKHDFDSFILFPPMNLSLKPLSPITSNNNFKGSVFDYREALVQSLQAKNPDYLMFRGVMPSWDNTARRLENSSVFINSSPALYNQWLKAAISQTRNTLPSSHQFIFINAWNEWAEGAHLEPDEKYGYSFLEATFEALNPVHPVKKFFKHLRKLFNQ